MARAALFLAAALGLAPGQCSHRRPSHEGGGETAKAPPDLSIFFASDVRGHTDLLARRATLIDRARLELPVIVQVDAGDLVPPGESGDVVRTARVLLTTYARMGVDAMTAGESEVALGPGTFKSMAVEAGVPVVAANLVDSSGALVFERDRVVETAKGLVGIFGIVEPSAEVSASWSRWGLATLDPIAETRAAVASLRARGARIVIGLFNGAGGTRRAAQIGRMAAGVDLIVVGSSERDGDSFVGGRPLVVRTGEGGGQIGRVDMRLPNGRLAIGEQTLALTPDIPDQLGVGLVLRLDAGPVARTRTGTRFERWTYASNEACGFCHKPELAQWQTTGHALAFASLRDSGHGAEAACLGCHMTGFLRPGGTQFIDTAVEQMADVGCESCHGPSADHVASVNKKKGTSRRVDATICLGCHTPDQSVERFDVTSAMKKIVGPGHGEADPR